MYLYKKYNNYISIVNGLFVGAIIFQDQQKNKHVQIMIC